eukprot:COSAG01_NODE_18687_length_1060_cov_0.941727_1_plen_158_part_00
MVAVHQRVCRRFRHPPPPNDWPCWTQPPSSDAGIGQAEFQVCHAFVLKTEAVAEIPLCFYSFLPRFLSWNMVLDGTPSGICVFMIRTDAVTDIPRRFFSFLCLFIIILSIDENHWRGCRGCRPGCRCRRHHPHHRYRVFNDAPCPPLTSHLLATAPQ